MLNENKHFAPNGAWLSLYFVATTISPLRGYGQSGLTVGSGALPTLHIQFYRSAPASSLLKRDRQ